MARFADIEAGYAYFPVEGVEYRVFIEQAGQGRRASRGLSPLSCSQRLFIFALQMRLNDRVALRIEGDCADRRPVACAA